MEINLVQVSCQPPNRNLCTYNYRDREFTSAPSASVQRGGGALMQQDYEKSISISVDLSTQTCFKQADKQ